MQQELPLSLRLTYEAGTNLREAIQTHLASWPVGQRNFSVSYEDAPDDVRRTADDLVDRAATWFNRVTVNVLPYTAFDRVQLACCSEEWWLP